jgi:CRP/FNR family transcriptional regulator
MKTTIATQTGEERVVGFHLPGEVIGFDAVESGVHGCEAIALETTSVCRIPSDQLLDLGQTRPQLHLRIYQLVSREINNMQSMLLLLGNRSAEERWAAFLLSLAARFKSRGFSEHEFVLSMSRKDIASYLGLAVETLSRLITRLQTEHILRVNRRHIRVLDMDRLRDLASPCEIGERQLSS